MRITLVVPSSELASPSTSLSIGVTVLPSLAVSSPRLPQQTLRSHVQSGSELYDASRLYPAVHAYFLPRACALLCVFRMFAP